MKAHGELFKPVDLHGNKNNTINKRNPRNSMLRKRNSKPRKVCCFQHETIKSNFSKRRK